MQSIQFSPTHWAQIRTHIDDSPTQEICGLVGGVVRRNIAMVYRVIPIINIAATPHNRYQMHPAEQVKAFVDFEKQGWEVVGIYHSHPQGEPIPSSSDIAEANYPDVAYIIGVPQGNINAWRIQGDVVSPIGINLSE